MSRVLKAEALRGLGSKIVFDFEDVQVKSDAQVAEARRRAVEIVADAEREAAAIRNRANDEGRRDGLADGLANADAEIEARATARSNVLVAEETRNILPAVKAVADSLEVERDRWLAEWEDRAIDLVVAIAERVVRAEIAVRPDAVRETLAEVLRLVAGTERLDVRMSPADLERLGPNAPELVESLSGCATPTLIPDESVEPGGCRVETAHGVVDATVDTQIARIVSELRAEEAA